MEGRVRSRRPSVAETAGKCNGVVNSMTTPDAKNVRKLIYRLKPTLESRLLSVKRPVAGIGLKAKSPLPIR